MEAKSGSDTSPRDVPVRVRGAAPAAASTRRRCRLGAVLALLAAAATVTMALNLYAVEGGPWQSLTQWLSGSERAPEDKWVRSEPAATAPSPFSLPKGVQVPPKFASSRGKKLSSEFLCFSTRDYGVIARLASASREFCAESVESEAGDEMVVSTYTHYELKDADLMATTFRHLRLDLRAAKVAHDITTVSQDGSLHDPRVTYAHNLSECSCASPQDHAHGVPRVWRFALSEDLHENYVACSARPMTQTQWRSGVDAGDNPIVIAGRNTVVLSRKEDHNPFFQLSALLNAWIALRAVAWSPDSTQLVFLDKGLPTAMDELQQSLLAPRAPAIRGEDVHGRVLHLESALIAPFEASGPLGSHLSDKQPCEHNQLLVEFRREALATMGVSDGVQTTSSDDRRIVTVVSRRAYSGRKIARIWLNEDEVLDKMRSDYGDEFVFRSLDFANLTVAQQMARAIESDVVIGMHGAGLVNVAWTQPGTLVVEIFPKRTYQWGGRNLCQFLGCDWHEFRGGKDHKAGRDPNPYAMDKSIDYDEWAAFIGPLLRARLADSSSA